MSKIALVYRKKRKGGNSIESVFRPMDNLKGIHRVELPYFLNSISNALKLITFAFTIRQKNIHVTGDVHYIVFFLFWKRSILTIHDCNHYENLKGVRKLLMGLIWYVFPSWAANKIAVISPFTKEQLQSHFKISDTKIIVIPNSFFPIPKYEKQIKRSSFTILAIGSNPHKNIRRLIEAIVSIPNCELIIVGTLSEELKLLITKSGIPLINNFNISRDELERYFNMSHALFFASLKEGFGLPILEAQSCGLPVITSNTTSMPYVAGQGACLVDPYSVSDIQNAILRIKNEPDYVKELVLSGFENVKRFTEESYISSYKDLYQKVFGITK